MTPDKKKPTLEEVSTTIRLPKSLHTKITEIAVAEGKTPSQKIAQAVREHAAGYERTSKTVSTYTKKRKTP